MSGEQLADMLEAARLRRAAADSDAWAAMAGDETAAGELEAAAHAARVRADELEGALPLGIETS